MWDRRPRLSFAAASPREAKRGSWRSESAYKARIRCSIQKWTEERNDAGLSHEAALCEILDGGRRPALDSNVPRPGYAYPSRGCDRGGSDACLRFRAGKD